MLLLTRLFLILKLVSNQASLFLNKNVGQTSKFVVGRGEMPMCGSSRRSTQSFGRGRGPTGPQRTFLETNTRYGKHGHREIDESQLEDRKVEL